MALGMDSDVSDNFAAAVEQTAMWRMIDEVATSEGVQLFDIEFPSDGGASGRSGVVRVYITKPASADTGGAEDAPERRSSVTFEDCVRVTKRLLDIDEAEPFVPASCVLEVSSPGINRALRLPVHFVGAVGERVKVKFRNAQSSYQVVTGQLRAADDQNLEIESEEKKEVLRVNISDVKEARVDFKF